MTAYRGDRERLRARRDVLFARLVELEPAEGDDARAERKRLVVELDRVGRELRALDERRSAVLDAIRIHRPCPASWEHMLGTDRVRHCGTCETEVYDLTAMDAEEVDTFLADRGHACVRMYARRDGRYQPRACGSPRPVLLRASAVAIALGLGAAATFLREPTASSEERFAPPSDDLDLVMGYTTYTEPIGPPLANLKPGLARAL